MELVSSSTVATVSAGHHVANNATSHPFTLPERPHLLEVKNVMCRGIERTFYLSFATMSELMAFAKAVKKNIDMLRELASSQVM